MSIPPFDGSTPRLGLSTMKIGDVCDKERAFGDGTVDDKSDLPQLLERRNASAARP